MSLTLYIAFDKTIIKSIFQPLKKYFKSIFSATNELYMHIGQDSQCYIKIAAHLLHILFFSHSPY